MKKTRREFLKKVAYSAPVVVSLGMLAKPSDASAERPPKDTEKSTTALNDYQDLPKYG